MNGIVKNDVYISALQRTDQGSNLTCQAQNNDITKPAQTTIKINMSCKLKITIKLYIYIVTLKRPYNIQFAIFFLCDQ